MVLGEASHNRPRSPLVPGCACERSRFAHVAALRGSGIATHVGLFRVGIAGLALSGRLHHAGAGRLARQRAGAIRPLREGGVRSGEEPRHRRSLGRVPVELSDRLSCRSGPRLCQEAERNGAKPCTVSKRVAVCLRQPRCSGCGGLLGWRSTRRTRAELSSDRQLERGRARYLDGAYRCARGRLSLVQARHSQRQDRLSIPAINGAAFSARPEPSGPTCTRPVPSLDCRPRFAPDFRSLRRAIKARETSSVSGRPCRWHRWPPPSRRRRG